MKTITKTGSIPVLRFPEFDDEWKEKTIEQIFHFHTTHSFSRSQLNYEKGYLKNIHYGDIHTKFQAAFDITKEKVPYINEDINISKISESSFCKEGDVVIADASEDNKDIGKAIELLNLDNQKVVAGLHTFLLRKKYEEKLALGFTNQLMKTWTIRNQLMRIATGVSVLGISKGNLSKVKIHIPSFQEQQKIASFLSSVDKWIQNLRAQKEQLELYKKGMMQKIFSQEIRFKDDNGNDFPDWEEKRLGDCLIYEQPTKYIVKNTEYHDSYRIPVLTAGKSFILGYTNEEDGVYTDELPVIIFDDFTTTSNFVDFPFKVKSSAIKLLKQNRNNNIKFLYAAIKQIKYRVSGHSRHWISKYSNIEISTPTFYEQQKIADFVNWTDIFISNTEVKIDLCQEWKKSLMQKIFL